MKLVTISLALIFLSSNFANASSISKLYIKQANAPIITNHEQAKELANMKAQLEDITNLQIIPETNSSSKLARKGGGKTASTDILGTYRLNSSSGSLFLDIIDAQIAKDGTGAIEFALSNADGFLLAHSAGIVLKNQLSFQLVTIIGAVYYAISLNPQKNYSGSGAAVIELVADGCADASGDSFFEIGELYICQFTGSDISSFGVTLDRLR